MTNAVTLPQPDRGPAGVPAAVEFHYTQTESFPALLAELGASLLANKLLVVRRSGADSRRLCAPSSGRWVWPRPRGRLAIRTRNQMWLLRDAPDLAPRVEPVGMHDSCYLPRSCHVTGDIGVHEMAWAGEELWIVSTRFSCLCTLAPDSSFVPRGQPPFVTAPGAEDRCHLNGLCPTGAWAVCRPGPP